MNKFGEDYAPKSWLAVTALIVVLVAVRSEERRVGKEC